MASTFCDAYNELVSWIVQDMKERQEQSQDEVIRLRQPVYFLDPETKLTVDNAKKKKVFLQVAYQMKKDNILQLTLDGNEGSRIIRHPDFDFDSFRFCEAERCAWGAGLFQSEYDEIVALKMDSIEQFLGDAPSTTSTMPRAPPSNSNPNSSTPNNSTPNLFEASTAASMEGPKTPQLDNMVWKMTFPDDGEPGYRQRHIQKAVEEAGLIEMTPIAENILQVEALVNRERSGASAFGKKYGHLVEIISSDNSPSQETRSRPKKRKLNDSRRPRRKTPIDLNAPLRWISPQSKINEKSVNSQSMPIDLTEPSRYVSPYAPQSTSNEKNPDLEIVSVLPILQKKTSSPKPASAQAEALAKQAPTLKMDMDEDIPTNKALMDIIKAQNNEIALLKADAENRKREQEAFEELMHNLVAQHTSGLSSRVASLSQRTDDQDAQITQLKEDSAKRIKLEDRLKELEDRIQAQTKDIESLKFRIETRHTEVGLFRKSIEIRVADTETLQRAHTVWEKECQIRVNALRDRFQAHLTDVKERRDTDSEFKVNLRNELDIHMETFAQLGGDLNIMKMGKEAFEKGIEDRVEARLELIMSEDADTIADAEKRMKALEKEVADLKAKLKKLDDAKKYGDGKKK